MIEAVHPEHIQQVLRTLHTISKSHRAMEQYTDLLQGQRDRLMVELARAKLTLREIAPWAGLHHTRIGKIIKHTAPNSRFLLLTPEIPDWNVASPEEVIYFLQKNYPSEPSPTSKELAVLLDESRRRISTIKSTPPPWPWWSATVYDVTERASTDRTGLSVLDVLSAVRAIMLSAAWRVAMDGEDAHQDLRDRWLSCLARLVSDVKQQDWRLDLINGIITQPKDPP